MPTRILVWNIQKFSKPKIYNADTRRGKRCEKGTSISKSDAAFDRLDYITTHIDLDVAGVPTPPDIIFIVEPQSKVGTRGHLALGKGAVGLRDLLDEIRHCTGVATWMMVPPILASTKESVGIFYNSATHAFTGPWQWPGGNGPAFDPAAALARRNYPAVYKNRMPDRPVPNNDPLTPNGGVNERRAAGCATGSHRWLCRLFHDIDAAPQESEIQREANGRAGDLSRQSLRRPKHHRSRKKVLVHRQRHRTLWRRGCRRTSRKHDDLEWCRGLSLRSLST